MNKLLLLSAVLIKTVYAQTWSDIVLFEYDSAVVNDQFGSSVSVDGIKLVVGVNGYSGFEGAVFTYLWDEEETTWGNEQIISPTDLAVGDNFGKAVSVNGDKMVVGAKGTVYTYVWDGSTWGSEQKITSNPFSTNFGAKVYVDGDKMVVGDNNDSTAASSAGSVYTYKWDGSTWGSEQVIYPTGADVSSYNFGFAVAISGNKMAIGAFGSDFGIAGGGSVFTYTWSGTAWVASTHVVASDIQSGDSFGRFLSIDSDKLVIYSRVDSGASTNTGAVYTYLWSGSAWGSETKLYASDPITNNYFGESLYLNGNTLVVGASGDDTVISNGGAIYRYEWTGSNWGSEIKQTFANSISNTYLGKDLSSSANFIVSGIKSWNGVASAGGAIVYYHLIPPVIVNIGSAEINYNVKNGTARKNVALNAISAIKQSYDGLEFNVASTETANAPVALYNDVSNVTLFKDSLAKARGCYPDCTISIDAGSRRMLQTSGNIEFTITFDLTEEAYNTLVASGNELDDASFINELAAELGVNSSSVSIDVVGGEVVLTINYSLEEGDDPTGSDDILVLQQIQASLDNATQTLVEELGEPSDSVTLITLDLCGDRDCNGRGTCDSNTGICTCTGSWWGIDCETECECSNGGTCVDGYCNCVYPYYDMKCSTELDCNTCATN